VQKRSRQLAAGGYGLWQCACWVCGGKSVYGEGSKSTLNSVCIHKIGREARRLALRGVEVSLQKKRGLQGPSGSPRPVADEGRFTRGK